MRRLTVSLQIPCMIVAGVGALTMASPRAIALPRCPEGQTLSGECVNPLLAQVQRRQAVIDAQPRLSKQAALNLPSEDAFYPVAQNLNEPTTYVRSTQTLRQVGPRPVVVRLNPAFVARSR